MNVLVCSLLAMTMGAGSAPPSDVVRVMPFGDSITTCCHECQVQTAVVAPPFHAFLTEPRRPWAGYVNTLWRLLRDDGALEKVVFVGRKTECMRNLSRPPMRVPREWDLRYEGYYGHTARQLAKLLPGALEASDPHIVLLHAGTNDVIDPHHGGRPSRPATAATHLRHMVKVMLAHPSVRHVVVAQIIPVAMWTKRSRRSTDFGALRHVAVLTAMEREVPELNAMIRRMFGKGSPRVSVVDMYTGLNISTDLHGDGLHPNERGEAMMATRWRDALVPLLEGATLPKNQQSLNPLTVAPYGSDVRKTSLFTDENVMPSTMWTGEVVSITTVVQMVTASGVVSIFLFFRRRNRR